MDTGGRGLQVGQDAALVPEQTAVAQLDGGDEVGTSAHLGFVPGTQTHSQYLSGSTTWRCLTRSVKVAFTELTHQPGSVRTKTPSPAGPAAVRLPAAQQHNTTCLFTHNPQRGPSVRRLQGDHAHKQKQQQQKQQVDVTATHLLVIS